MLRLKENHSSLRVRSDHCQARSRRAHSRHCLFRRDPHSAERNEKNVIRLEIHVGRLRSSIFFMELSLTSSRRPFADMHTPSSCGIRPTRQRQRL